jgi:hypothetical protein
MSKKNVVSEQAQIQLLRDLQERLYKDRKFFSAIVWGFGDVPHLRIPGIPREIVIAGGSFDIWAMAPAGGLLEGGFNQDQIIDRITELKAENG